MATAPRTEVATETTVAEAAVLAVRPGEDPWTEAELSEVRQTLEEEAAGMRADIAEAEAAGVKTYEREHEFAMTSNSRNLLEQTEKALARIDAGSYGVCESCGEPIGKARLMAFPRAVLCVTCKQREERR